MSRLVTVHAGPLWEIELLQGRLESEGIPSFQPDGTMNRMDPFITGGNPLDVRLQVPVERAEEALALVAEYREATREEKPSEEELATEDGRREARLAAQTRRGRRIRWGAILWVTAPIALVLGGIYLWDLRPNEERPPNHGLTIAAIFLAAGLTVLTAIGITHAIRSG